MIKSIDLWKHLGEVIHISKGKYSVGDFPTGDYVIVDVKDSKLFLYDIRNTRIYIGYIDDAPDIENIKEYNFNKDDFDKIELFYTRVNDKMDFLEESLTVLIMKLSDEGWTKDSKEKNISPFIKKLELIRMAKFAIQSNKDD